MKYAGIKYNDTVDGEKVCVSFWTQGCPHHCKDCHNPETWSFEDGYDVPVDIKEQIITAINKNGVQRNFSVLGGEPLCSENLQLISEIISSVREAYPNIIIYVWTGYIYDNLDKSNEYLKSIFSNIDYLIDGPYLAEKRNITLFLRGSENQRVIDMKKTLQNDNEQIILHEKNSLNMMGK